MASFIAARVDVATGGPVLIECILQSVCQGVIFAQAARYWEYPLNDTLRMKSYVMTLVGLSLLQTMLTAYKLWYIFVYLKYWSTSPIVWADLFLNGLICTVCEVSLLRRCWKVTEKRIWVTVPLAFLLATLFIANVYLTVALAVGHKHGIVNDSPLRAQMAKFSINYWIFGSLALDVTITTILMVYLWHSKTGLDNLDKALKHIIAITWESALVPSTFQIIAVSLYNSKSRESRHLVLCFLLMTGKLYTLGIMRSLNSRPDLRCRMTSDDIGRTSLGDWQWGDEQTSSVARRSSEVR
ncbi:hypothetical protein BC826DRAFT_201493 [Russula brevipes]|nr:hypothetical protein BC826DRAFT_201493 [Russula brevipes]